MREAGRADLALCGLTITNVLRWIYRSRQLCSKEYTRCLSREVEARGNSEWRYGCGCSRRLFWHKVEEYLANGEIGVTNVGIGTSKNKLFNVALVGRPNVRFGFGPENFGAQLVSAGARGVEYLLRMLH